MLTLPTTYLNLILPFAPLFSAAIWPYAQVLLIGAILTPGQRTVTAVLRIMGLSQEKHFQNYHRVLNRAKWSSYLVSRILLGLLVQTFVPTGTIVLGLDDTIERRRGAKIKAKGIYRDPVRSSHSHFVKASGLRWLSLMLLVPIPWSHRVWALPFLTVLAPSERYYQNRKRTSKKLTDWARQVLRQARRWLPGRRIVVVADAGFAAIDLIWQVSQRRDPLCMVTRFRLDANLYQPAPRRRRKQKGRPPVKGKTLPKLTAVLANPHTMWTTVRINDWYGESQRTVELTSGTAVWYHSGLPVLPIRWVLIRDPKGRFKPQALLCTDLASKPKQIVEWFIQRWQIEATFHEVRTHLGVETQRQWADAAIARTTPALFGLFSLVTLLAHQHATQNALPVRQTAWYAKPVPTFSDALAAVRQHLWSDPGFLLSLFKVDIAKVPALLASCMTQALC
ncbi:MAG: transposase [Anaerolineae bacterium]